MDIDWQSLTAVVGTTVAVAAAVSGFVTYWLRRREEPEADWAIRGSAHISQPGQIYAQGSVHNAGDGVAFRVTMKGRDCTASQQDQGSGGSPFGAARYDVRFVSVLTPGDSMYAHAKCAESDWGVAEIDIEWTPPPTRRGNE